MVSESEWGTRTFGQMDSVCIGFIQQGGLAGALSGKPKGERTFRQGGTACVWHCMCIRGGEISVISTSPLG